MSAFTFQVDVSRTYRNKDGYSAGGYRLNTSFKTETHTPESFLDSVIRQGWPYTMAHLKRSPQETGAAVRGVITPKHTENFVSRQELTGDDDSDRPGVVDFWLHDSFFAAYGWSFVESANSKPGAERGHPTFIFDRPITDPELYHEAAHGLAWKYPQLDQGIHNLDRTIYNAVGAHVHLLGNICPLDVFEREILTPYRRHIAAQAALEAEYQARRKVELEQARAEGKLRTDADSVEKYLNRTLDGIFNFVARQSDNRHSAIYWAGRKIGALEAAAWTPPHNFLFADVEARIEAAASANGYTSHPNGGKAEILRTFADGRRFGALSPAAQPELYDRPAKQAPAGPGPKERERLAARDKYQADAQTRAAELDARTRAHFDPDAIPFTIADDEEYRLKIARTRDTFSNAAAWKEYVEFHHPELDSAWEYQVKLQENREHKMSFCGRPFKRLTCTGEHKPGRILCGLCESCKRLDRLNLRRALEAAVLADPDTCLTMVTVADKADRAKVTRRLREADISYKSFPVVNELHTGYDILAGSAASAMLAEYEPAELLLVNLNDATLNRWLETPEGERQSGDLIPSRRKLHEIGEPDKWECDPGPDTFSLELPGVVCEGELPEVYVEQKVHDVLSLQNALNEMADRQRSLMVRRGHVILGVITMRKYYALNDEKVICEEFTRLNGERRGRIEARRGKK